MKSKGLIWPSVLIVFILMIAYVFMGPNPSFQFPPIEPKAQAYLDKHKIMPLGETLIGYITLSKNDYSEAIVLTSNQLLHQHNGKITNYIPLQKISEVRVSDTVLGLKEIVFFSGKQNFLGFAVAKSKIPDILKAANISEDKVTYVAPRPKQKK